MGEIDLTQTDDDIDRFLGFLDDTNKASRAALLRVRRSFVNGGDQRIGQIAVLRGFMKPSDVLSIVRLQATSDLWFGALAVRERLLSEAQLDELLAMQAKPYLQAFEVLRFVRVVPETEAREIAESYEQRTPGARRGTPTIDPARVRAAIRSMTSLAALPVVIQRALQQLDARDAKLEIVAQTIEADPALAAQVLRLANSAFFGARRTVANIRAAILTLGTSNVRQVLLTASVMDRFRAKDSKAFWIANLRCAQWARVLAREIAREIADDAFTAGLLANIGQLVVQQVFREASLVIETQVLASVPRGVAETRAIGLTHPDVGALLCNEWQFAPQLIEAVQYHHAPPAGLGSLRVGHVARIVNAASRLAEMPLGDAGAAVATLEEEFFDYHGLTASTLIATFPAVMQETEGLTSLLL